jgi:DNA-binding GntR family transcriptional regulator
VTDALPKPLPYHLAERIRHAIVTGRHPPGAPLREQALEAEYGCSRGPVREALRLLDQRGLVTHAPRHGFRVRMLGVDEIRQIYVLRALLEKHATEGLEGRVTPALLDTLRDANARMKGHRAAGEVDGYLQANLAFHALMRAAAPNPALERSLDVVNEMAEPLRHALLQRGLGRSSAAEQHDAIIALLAEDRVAEAAAAMHRHVLHGLPAALATGSGEQG